MIPANRTHRRRPPEEMEPRSTVVLRRHKWCRSTRRQHATGMPRALRPRNLVGVTNVLRLSRQREVPTRTRDSIAASLASDASVLPIPFSVSVFRESIEHFKRQPRTCHRRAPYARFICPPGETLRWNKQPVSVCSYSCLPPLPSSEDGACLFLCIKKPRTTTPTPILSCVVTS